MSDDAPMAVEVENAVGAVRFGLVDRQVIGDSSLSDGAVRLYGLLSTYANRATGDAFPSRARLLAELGWSWRKLRRAREELAENGVVTYTTSESAPTIYHLHHLGAPRAEGGGVCAPPSPETSQGGGRGRPPGGASVVQGGGRGRPPKQTKEQTKEQTTSPRSVSGSPLRSEPSNGPAPDGGVSDDPALPGFEDETHPAGRSRKVPDEGFDEFWSLYPKRVAKGDAIRAWKRWRKAGVPGDVIHRCAARFAKGCAEADTDRRFIPYPATWLNQMPWEDEVPSEPPETDRYRNTFEEERARLEAEEDDDTRWVPCEDPDWIAGR